MSSSSVVPQVDPASGMPAVDFSPPDSPDPTEHHDLRIAPAADEHPFTQRVRDWMSMPADKYDSKYAADDKHISDKVDKVAGAVIPFYKQMTAAQPEIEKTKLGSQLHTFVQDQLNHPEYLAMGGEFGGEGSAAEGLMTAAERLPENAKMLGGKIADALAHPTEGVSPAEGNPEAGVIRGGKKKLRIEPVADLHTSNPDLRMQPAAEISHTGTREGANEVKLKVGGEDKGALYYSHDGDRASVNSSWVDESARGQGHGQTMILEAAQKAKEQGAKTFTSDADGQTSADATRMWDALVEKGKANRAGDAAIEDGEPAYFMKLTDDNPQSGYEPTLQKVADAHGVSENPAGVKNGASFITPDGKFIHLSGIDHPEAIRRATGEETDMTGVRGTEDKRRDFLDNTGAVRTRFSKDRGGNTLHVSVPEKGVTPEQIPALKEAIAQAGRNGNVVMERADITPETKDQLSMKKDFPRPADAEEYLRQIQAHPEHKELAANITAAHEANGGSTFNQSRGNLAGTDNYAVAAFPERGEITEGKLNPAHVEQFAAKNRDVLADSKNSIGTWANEGKNYLDIVHTIPDRDAAVKMGQDNNQKAIFNLKDNTEIPTGGTGQVSPKGSSVPLYGAPLDIKGVKAGETPAVTDVAKALSKFTEKTLGKLVLGKAEDQAMVERAKPLAEDEARYQLSQNNTGEAWYTKDIGIHDDVLREMRPELSDPNKLSLFKAAEAVLSSGQKPYGNFKAAVKAWDAYAKTGSFPRMNPETGKSWGPRGEAAYGNAMDMISRLISEKGEEGASKWLLSKHPISELREYNADGVSGRKNDELPGAYILGAKRGPFALNLHGHEAEFTADMWVSRTWNRWMGTAETGVDPRTGNPELTSDAPRSGKERSLMKQSFEQTAQKLGKSTSQLQAILWYYEQGLYRAHGLKTESWSFSDAAKRAQREAGAPAQSAMFDEDGNSVKPTKSGGHVNALDFLKALGGKK